MLRATLIGAVNRMPTLLAACSETCSCFQGRTGHREVIQLYEYLAGPDWTCVTHTAQDSAQGFFAGSYTAGGFMSWQSLDSASFQQERKLVQAQESDLSSPKDDTFVFRHMAEAHGHVPTKGRASFIGNVATAITFCGMKPGACRWWVVDLAS